MWAGASTRDSAERFFSAVAIGFFAWRVTRGGRISRTLLILSAEKSFSVTAAGIASHFTLLTVAELAAFAAQVGLLLSPAVYQRTRPADWTPQAGWDRLRPLLALPLLGVLAGLVVTLIGLSHMSGPPTGCDYAAAGQLPMSTCLVVAEGTPLPWLTAYHSAPIVHWAAMLKDWAQYAVIGAADLYGLWLITRARREQIGGVGRWDAAATAIVGSALAGLTFTVLAGGVPLTWVTARQYQPTFSGRALVADTALWSLIALSGCVAVRLLIRRTRPAAGSVGLP